MQIDKFGKMKTLYIVDRCMYNRKHFNKYFKHIHFNVHVDILFYEILFNK